MFTKVDKIQWDFFLNEKRQDQCFQLQMVNCLREKRIVFLFVESTLLASHTVYKY